MKFLDYLKTFKLYDEGLYLLSSFTFGFELEAWGSEEYDKDDFGDWANNYFRGKGINTSTVDMKDDESITTNDGMYDREECYDCYGAGRLDCDNCGGDGEIREMCDNCGGTGELTCDVCGGDGYTTDEEGKEIDCTSCGGNGAIVCDKCGGDGYTNEECTNCEGSGQVDCYACDGSGTVESGDEDPRTFEWTSPIFDLTIQNLGKVITFLDDTVHKDINTNNTCGFHVHIGFPDKDMVGPDMFWVLCQMLMLDEGKMFEEIQSFKGFELKSTAYANPEHVLKIKKQGLHEIKSRINHFIKPDIDKYFEELFIRFMPKFYTNIKFSLLRQHPQGTLEWRGPRNFLNSKKRDDISDFFIKKLYPFIQWINDTLELKELKIGKYSLSKKRFREIIENNEEFGRTVRSRKKRSNKFNWRKQDPKIIPEIYKRYPWLGNKNVKFKNAFIFLHEDNLYIKDVTWLSGDFKEGTIDSGEFRGGRFLNGTFYDGSFYDGQFINGKFKDSHFYGGEFLGGKFIKSVFRNGIFKGGTFEKSSWAPNKLHWQGGIWKSGQMIIDYTWHELDVNPVKYSNNKANEIKINIIKHIEPNIVITRDLLGRIPSQGEREERRDYYKKIKEILKTIQTGQIEREDADQAGIEIDEEVKNY